MTEKEKSYKAFAISKIIIIGRNLGTIKRENYEIY